jgi:hypothetical protein
MAVEDNFYFSLLDSHHLIINTIVTLPSLVVLIKDVCLNIFVYLVASLTRHLQIDDYDLPPKVELVGEVQMVIFFSSLSA